jgi:uncharacterized protein YodC (DUF2158 family)
MIKNLLLTFFGPSSKFNVGDSVQPVRGNQELMVVTGFKREHKSKEPLVRCQWYDIEEKKEKTMVFEEKELEPFDWHNPKRRVF